MGTSSLTSFGSCPTQVVGTIGDLPMMRSQVPNQPQVGAKLLKLWNCGGLGARSQLLTLKGVEGRVEVPKLD
jgi:hypothetical protein